jgi:urea transport system ATP-binding protein
MNVRDPNIDEAMLLFMEDVSVSFDGFKAINKLNLYIEEGELRCIIGPNGAGKSTMMDIVTGKTRPDSGTVFFGGSVDLLELDEPEIAEVGIGRKFQKPTVFEALTVFENLEVAVEGDRHPVFNWRFGLNHEQRECIAVVAEVIGLADQLTTPAKILSHGQKQWLEIGMLLVQQPKLLLVDEPVAGMTHQEMDRTGELLTRLAGTHTVVVVEHDMDFVRSLNSRVTVLHQGSVLAEGSMSDIQANNEVKRVYLGE